MSSVHMSVVACLGLSSQHQMPFCVFGWMRGAGKSGLGGSKVTAIEGANRMQHLSLDVWQGWIAWLMRMSLHPGLPGHAAPTLRLPGQSPSVTFSPCRLQEANQLQTRLMVCGVNCKSNWLIIEAVWSVPSFFRYQIASLFTLRFSSPFIICSSFFFSCIYPLIVIEDISSRVWWNQNAAAAAVAAQEEWNKHDTKIHYMCMTVHECQLTDTGGRWEPAAVWVQQHVFAQTLKTRYIDSAPSIILHIIKNKYWRCCMSAMVVCIQTFQVGSCVARKRFLE